MWYDAHQANLIPLNKPAKPPAYFLFELLKILESKENHQTVLIFGHILHLFHFYCSMQSVILTIGIKCIFFLKVNVWLNRFEEEQILSPLAFTLKNFIKGEEYVKMAKLLIDRGQADRDFHYTPGSVSASFSIDT